MTTVNSNYCLIASRFVEKCFKGNYFYVLGFEDVIRFIFGEKTAEKLQMIWLEIHLPISRKIREGYLEDSENLRDKYFWKVYNLLTKQGEYENLKNEKPFFAQNETMEVNW